MSFALSTAVQITARLDEMIEEVCPVAESRPMYGGMIFEKEPGKPSTMVCGHFIYKAHVGLEFANGYQLEDPQGLLSGSGKYRRHIKLYRVEDIDDKRALDFLQQAFSID